MSFARCPRCRTLYDAGVASRCFACGEAVNAVEAKQGPGAMRTGPEPSVQRATKDIGVVRWIFAAVGLIGVAGFGQSLLRMPAAGLEWVVGMGVIVILVIGIFILAKPSETRVSEAGKAVLNLFAVMGVLVAGGAAAVIGLVLLVFAVCAAGAGGGGL